MCIDILFNLELKNLVTSPSFRSWRSDLTEQSKGIFGLYNKTLFL